MPFCAASSVETSRTVTSNPSARSIAGCTTSAHGRLPKRSCASHSPATLPGTPAARCPDTERSVTLPSSSRYMSRVAARGAFLPVVLRIHGAAGEPDHHEPAPAQVPGLGIHHREGQAGCDRRVHRVAAGGEHVDADLRSVGVRGRHHAPGGRHGGGVRFEGPLRREDAARLEKGAGRGAARGVGLAPAEQEQEEGGEQPGALPLPVPRRCPAAAATRSPRTKPMRHSRRAASALDRCALRCSSDEQLRCAPFVAPCQPGASCLSVLARVHPRTPGSPRTKPMRHSRRAASALDRCALRCSSDEQLRARPSSRLASPALRASRCSPGFIHGLLGARGQSPCGIRGTLHPRWTAALCVAPRTSSSAARPSSRLASPALRASRCSPGFIHGLLGSVCGRVIRDSEYEGDGRLVR